MKWQPISYRDQDGFVVVKNHTVYRYVNFSYAKEYDHLLESGLYQILVNEGLLISHSETDLNDTGEEDYYKILIPDKINFISYPYEWSASQWKEVITQFLTINTICLEHGMILKDATPFNFTFHKGRCIFFDSLSFEFYEDGKPWLAYRQFCETMLGPFSLIYFKSRDWGKMMHAQINGWPLTFISSNLPTSSWFNACILLHIHWHAKYRQADKKIEQKSSFTGEKILVLLKMIQDSVQKWKLRSINTNWTDYYETGILSKMYFDTKVDIVSKWLDEIKPKQVIDLGANNGQFSLIAALYAKNVISVENEHNCIEDLRTQIREQNISNIDTVIADITQPTPGIGWNNEEREPLLQRLHGDMLLALALIHHLCIAANVPLSFVAQLFARITNKYALVEFIPRTDPKVIMMLYNRKDIFEDYTEEQFVECFSVYFNKIKIEDCTSSNRKLYLWERKQTIY
jgi:hypothetical protein